MSQPHKGSLRIRPPGAKTDADLYNPAYSFDNLFTGILEGLINGLRKENWPGWVTDVVRQHSLTEAQLSDAVYKFTVGCKTIWLEPNLKDPQEAFERSGYQALATPLKLIIQGRLGQLMTGAFFTVRSDATSLPLIDLSPSVKLNQLVRLAEANVPKIT